MAGYRRGPALPGSVVVVAGAAGAVGRAVAVALVRAGARPVLLDAASVELDRVVEACGGVGGTTVAGTAGGVMAVAVDLADGDAVRTAAGRAVQECGRLDGWVHCAVGPAPGAGAGAGVPEVDAAAPGGLLDLPLPEIARALDRDLMGALHGARAAVPHLLAGAGGVLVVVASLHGQVARPHEVVPGIAGAGVRVLAAALRQELRHVRPGVAVTAVLAPEPDAPGFLRGRPERVAATVLRQLRRPRLEKVAGGPVTKAVVHGHALVPGVTEWLVARVARHAGQGIGNFR